MKCVKFVLYTVDHHRLRRIFFIMFEKNFSILGSIEIIYDLQFLFVIKNTVNDHFFLIRKV